MDVSDLNSYIQLIQDIMAGTVRRHTFTPAELDLLLDVQASKMRKATKEETLRRYLRAVQQQFVMDGANPLRFAQFREDENQPLPPGEVRHPSGALVRAKTAVPA